MEILKMDAKAIQTYKKALEDGEEEVYSIRIMIVGPFGVGKTTFTKRLLGKAVDISDQNSTDGIDIHVNSCKVSLDKQEWIVDHEGNGLFRIYYNNNCQFKITHFV